MKGEFEMSMVGELTFFLRFQIKQENIGIFFSQEKYAKNLISKFGMDKARSKRTPAATYLKMTKDTNGEKVDTNLYWSIIGSLLYLTASRPNIAFTVGVCAWYQADPRTSHLHSEKRILKYISGTFNYGIWYTYDTTGTLVGYCDADWAGCTDDRKSTSRGCFFLGNNVAAWFSKKQNSVFLSTAEAEYIAAGSSCSQLLWMKQMLDEYGITQSSMILYCDNLSAISISKNLVQHSRRRHIDIQHHFIRELVEANIIRLEHVQSAFQLADIFTKPLDVATFEGLRASVGVCQRPTWKLVGQGPKLFPLSTYWASYSTLSPFELPAPQASNSKIHWVSCTKVIYLLIFLAFLWLVGIRLCRFSKALPILMLLTKNGHHSIQGVFIRYLLLQNLFDFLQFRRNGSHSSEVNNFLEREMVQRNSD